MKEDQFFKHFFLTARELLKYKFHVLNDIVLN